MRMVKWMSLIGLSGTCLALLGGCGGNSTWELLALGAGALYLVYSGVLGTST